MITQRRMLLRSLTWTVSFMVETVGDLVLVDVVIFIMILVGVLIEIHTEEMFSPFF